MYAIRSYYGLLQADLARQSVNAAAHRDHADFRLGQAEDGVGGGDDDVAGKRDLEAAAKAQSVHRCDLV